jgi:DNA-binding XRE family transcriptional regulator
MHTQGGPMACNNVKQIRESKMLSKAELAKKAGLSVQTIVRIEEGMLCRLDTQRKIILALGLELYDRSKVFRPAEMN